MLTSMNANSNMNIEFSEFANWGALPEDKVLTHLEQAEGVEKRDMKQKGKPLGT